MSTTKQDRDFVDSVISTDLLDSAVGWIQRNMEPGDVFSGHQLDAWARANGFAEAE